MGVEAYPAVLPGGRLAPAAERWCICVPRWDAVVAADLPGAGAPADPPTMSAAVANGTARPAAADQSRSATAPRTRPDHYRLMVRWMAYFRLKRRRSGSLRAVSHRTPEPGGTILTRVPEWRTTTIGPRQSSNMELPARHRGGVPSRGPRSPNIWPVRLPVRRWRGPARRQPGGGWGSPRRCGRHRALRAGARLRVQRAPRSRRRSAHSSPTTVVVRRQIRQPAVHRVVSDHRPYWARGPGRCRSDGPTHKSRWRQWDASWTSGNPSTTSCSRCSKAVEPVGLDADQSGCLLVPAGRLVRRLRPQEHPRPGGTSSTTTTPREIPALPLPGPLTLAELDDFLAGAGGYEGVRWERVADPVTGRATLPT